MKGKEGIRRVMETVDRKHERRRGVLKGRPQNRGVDLQEERMRGRED